MLKSKGEVLIIDDDPLLLMNYADLLEDNSYTVTEASSFVQAKNITASKKFDLIICDHDLGDGKGADLIKIWSDSGDSTPVIFLSGARKELLDNVGNFAAVKAVRAKPVPEYEILELVRKEIRKTDAESRYPKLINDDERNELLKNFTFITPEE